MKWVCHGLLDRYSFHFVDAVDPRARRATFKDGGDEAVAPKRLLLQIKVENKDKDKKQLFGRERHVFGGLFHVFSWVLKGFSWSFR